MNSSSDPNQHYESRMDMTRRYFFHRAGLGIGSAALGSLLKSDLQGSESRNPQGGLHGLPHFTPKAKRVIYLFQSGAPSQLDLFDPKPGLDKLFDQDLPESVRQGQRLTTMTSGQDRFPLAPSKYAFKRHGDSGAWISELMPHLPQVADDLCFIKSMHTEQINHDPAITFFQTGFQLAGRPSMGSWVSYGLGSANKDLPGFVVMVSRGTGRPSCQPLYDRLWGAGMLPSRYQGVKFLSVGDPVLYLSNPNGIDRKTRRRQLDDLAVLNQHRHEQIGDPEISTRIAQYELAYRMQMSVPDLTDTSDEPKSVLDMYGPDVHTRGTYANNCLLARRLAERDVRFIQLYHMGWDQHFTLPKQISGQCRDTDQPTTALLRDLKQRGMLDDTLVIWAGEFGRTVYCQGTLTRENYGRDHHPRCFTLWLAGGGIKPGISYGKTDEFSYNIVENPVHVNDLNATILTTLGINHKALSVPFQGLDLRLTGVEGHDTVRDILL
ncbi:MAG: DUF1501 domain-containing protein [Verrucomicrobia bacterium]|nr:DUF1501 domain-containing protein [Verrucomicrobiota bacterium]